MSIFGRLFSPRPPRYRWWLISRHRVLGCDAFVWGPFRSEDKARNYPATFGGWVDAVALRPSVYDHRVVCLPKGHRPAPEAPTRVYPTPAPLGALDLYLSTGRIPTGRTAEILRSAQEAHDRQQHDGRP